MLSPRQQGRQAGFGHVSAGGWVADWRIPGLKDAIRPSSADFTGGSLRPNCGIHISVQSTLMNNQSEQYKRWEPIDGLPEAPMSGFDCSFACGILVLTATYASSGEGRELRVEFDDVEAFKVYAEFSDPWMATGLSLPSLTGVDHRWRCPLQEVIHSTWIARVMSRNGGLEPHWRHFVISTMDRTLHVMASGPPRKVELGSA